MAPIAVDELTQIPVPPIELERQIFEICAGSRPVLIPKLMLVAWRVKQWVEPLLYRTVAVGYSVAIQGYPIFTWDVLLSVTRSKPACFFRDSVRHMCLNLRHDDIAEPLLAVCTGLENLSINLPDLKKLPPLIAPLLLKHLHAPLNPLFRDLPLNHQFFALITHLGLTWADRRTRSTPGGLLLCPSSRISPSVVGPESLYACVF
ncbi:hypothetical protein B0H13DRAFT_1043927 [Mycena leptocephala]|nr:hypothetical protein B0H13DRAFT_1043927 [Mycena leptocephala]